MNNRRSSILARCVLVGVIPNISFSQTPPRPPQPAPTDARQPLYDFQQFPVQRGVIQQFTLSGRGDIDGFILKDGTEVQTSPVLSTQLALSLKPGDQVTIHGLRAAALPLISAVSVTNDATRRTVSETDALAVSPPPPPSSPGPDRAPPPPPRGAVTEIGGRVHMPLHGPQGEINGVVLESGVVLRLPPDQADQFASLLRAQQPLVAQGICFSTALGTVVEVQAIGATRAQLQPVGPAAPLDPRARRSGLRPPMPSSVVIPPVRGAVLPLDDEST